MQAAGAVFTLSRRAPRGRFGQAEAVSRIAAAVDPAGGAYAALYNSQFE